MYTTGTSPAGIAQASGTSVTVIVSQLGANGGTAYVSVMSAGKRESARTSKTFAAQ